MLFNRHIITALQAFIVWAFFILPLFEGFGIL